MAQQFLNPDLTWSQLTQKLNFRVLMVVNKAAQKVRFPQLVLDNEIIIGLPVNSPQTKTLLEKKTTRFDVTNFVTNLQWNCSSKDGLTIDKRPMGASPIEVSISLDNFGNNFNLLPRGTMFIIQVRSPITSRTAEWKTYITSYLWEKSINVNGQGGDISLTCVDRLKWLELSDGPKDFQIDSEFQNLSGKNVTKIIQSLAKTYKFPLGKLAKIDYVPPLKELKDKGTGSLLDFIVLLLNMAAGNEEIKKNRKISFDIHARDGKINIVPIVTPKKVIRLTDEALIIDGTLQETVRDGFATQYVVESTVKVEVPPTEIAGTGTEAGQILSGNVAGEYTIDVAHQTGAAPKPDGSDTFYLPDDSNVELEFASHPIKVNYKPSKTGKTTVYNFPSDRVFHSPLGLKGRSIAVEMEGTGPTGKAYTVLKGFFGFPQVSGSRPDSGASTFYFTGMVLKETDTGKVVGYYGGELIVKTFKDNGSQVFPNDKSSARSASLDSANASPSGASLMSKSVSVVPKKSSGGRSSIAPEPNPNETSQTATAWQTQVITIPQGKSQNVVLVVRTDDFKKPISKPISVHVPDSAALNIMVKSGTTSDNVPIYTFPLLEGNYSSLSSGITFVGHVKGDAGGVAVSVDPPGEINFAAGRYTLEGKYVVRTLVKSGTSANGTGAGGDALMTEPTFEEKSKPLYVNPTSPYPQKAYGIIRKSQTPGEWSGTYLDVDPKTLKTPTQQKNFARKLLDQSIEPEFTLDISLMGIIGIWQNTYIYIDSTRFGIKGAFLVTRVSYTITGGQIAIDLTIKPTLKSRLTIAQTSPRLNQPGFIRY